MSSNTDSDRIVDRNLKNHKRSHQVLGAVPVFIASVFSLILPVYSLFLKPGGWAGVTVLGQNNKHLLPSPEWHINYFPHTDRLFNKWANNLKFKSFPGSQALAVFDR